MVPVRFWMEWGWAVPYTVHINIYAADGTVAICHGGVEVGQGINTKVCGSANAATLTTSRNILQSSILTLCSHVCLRNQKMLVMPFSLS